MKVRRLYGYSALAGAVKVRLSYGGSTWKVRHAYVQNTIQVLSSTVKVKYRSETFFWRLLYILEMCSVSTNGE